MVRTDLEVLSQMHIYWDKSLKFWDEENEYTDWDKFFIFRTQLFTDSGFCNWLFLRGERWRKERILRKIFEANRLILHGIDPDGGYWFKTVEKYNHVPSPISITERFQLVYKSLETRRDWLVKAIEVEKSKTGQS